MENFALLISGVSAGCAVCERCKPRLLLGCALGLLRFKRSPDRAELRPWLIPIGQLSMIDRLAVSAVAFAHFEIGQLHKQTYRAQVFQIGPCGAT